MSQSNRLLHSTIQGKGLPLLILHGYFGMGDNWKSQANKLASHYQVHLIDQRNHGRSFHTDDFDYELMAEDLLNYMDFYQIDTAYVLGHSMGGKTAMYFAVSYPDRVKKLIVADIAPKNYPPHHHDILTALNQVDFSKITLRSEVDNILKVSIPEEGVRQFLLKNVYRKTKDSLAFRFNLESLTKNNDEIGVPLTSFSEYHGPVLFLKGENSGYISQDDVSLIKAHFSSSKIVSIKNAGHWLHAENPRDFLKEVLDFL